MLTVVGGEERPICCASMSMSMIAHATTPRHRKDDNESDEYVNHDIAELFHFVQLGR